MAMSADEVNRTAGDCHISYAAYRKLKLHCEIWMNTTILK
jgi:hypothetical protein